MLHKAIIEKKSGFRPLTELELFATSGGQDEPTSGGGGDVVTGPPIDVVGSSTTVFDSTYSLPASTAQPVDATALYGPTLEPAQSSNEEDAGISLDYSIPTDIPEPETPPSDVDQFLTDIESIISLDDDDLSLQVDDGITFGIKLDGTEANVTYEF